MKDNKKTEIRVGITVVIAVIIFLWVLGWAKNFSFASEDRILSVRFNNIAGLDAGDAVMINGVRQGDVDEVIAKENYVIVKLSIENDADIRSDASFSIMMLDLMGGKKIEIIPGISPIKIDYSTTHDGYFLGDISTAMAMLSSVQSDLVDVIKEIKISLSNMNKIIADDKFNNNLKKAVENFYLITSNFNRILNENKEELTSLVETSNELAATANNLLKDNYSNIDSTFKGINKLIANSDNLFIKLNHLTDEVQNGNNNLGMLLYDDSLMEDIISSMKQIKELTQILIDQLKGEGINVKADIDLF